MSHGILERQEDGTAKLQAGLSQLSHRAGQVRNWKPDWGAQAGFSASKDQCQLVLAHQASQLAVESTAHTAY